MVFNLTQVRVLKINKTKDTHAGKYVGKEENLLLVGVQTNTATAEISVKITQKSGTVLCYNLPVPLWVINPKDFIL